MDSEELILRFVAIDAVSSVVEGIGKKIEDFGKKIEGMTGAAGPVGEAIGASIGAAAAAVGGFLAAGAGLFALLDHLATKTSDYSVSILRNSSLLHGNAELYQTMVQAGDLLGLSQDSLNQLLQRFNKNLAVGVPGLQAAGTSLHDLGIEGLTTDQALLKLADDFAAMNNEQERAAVATALFGRNSRAMTFILGLGSNGIHELTREFKDFGLVLTDGQLQVGGLAKLMHERLQLELKGLQLQVGTQLETAFTVFWSVMSKVLGQGAGLAHVFADAMANAVIWISAFIAAVTGNTVKLEDFLGVLKGQSALLSLNSAATDENTGTTINNTTALQGQIDVLNEQKAALQDQQRIFDDASRSTVDSLNAEKEAYDRVVDDQIRTLDLQRQQIELAHQQAAEQAKLSDLGKKVAKDQHDVAVAAFFQADTGALMRNQALDQQALLDEQTNAKYQSDLAAVDSTKNSLTEQKRVHDQELGDRIKAIETERKAYDASIADQIRAVDNQTKELQKQLKIQTDAATSANLNQLQSAGDTTTGIKEFYDSLTASLSANFASTSANGTKAFNDIKDAAATVVGAIDDLNASLKTINDTLKTIGDTAHNVGGFFEHLLKPLTVSLDLATKFGQGLAGKGKGLEPSLQEGLAGVVLGASDPVQVAFLLDEKKRGYEEFTAIADWGNTSADKLTAGSLRAAGYLHGGPVMEPYGAPVQAVVHGGEYVVPSKGALVQANPEHTGLLRQIRDILAHIDNDSPAPGAWAAATIAG